MLRLVMLNCHNLQLLNGVVILNAVVSREPGMFISTSEFI